LCAAHRGPGALWRAWIIAAVAGLALLLGGCSLALKFSYHRGPTLTYWWMNSYVDFNDRQSPRAHALITQWFAWNRTQKLPEYAHLLDQASAQVVQPQIAPAAMCAMADRVEHEMLAGFDQAVPSLAEVALTLTPQQVQHIAERFAKNNDKFRDKFLSGSADERLQARVKEADDRFTAVYGALDDAQRHRLRQLEAASPYDPERWLAEREALHREVLQDLRDLLTARDRGTAHDALVAQAQAAFRAVGEHAAHSPRPDYAALQQKVWDYNCSLASQMHATMNAEQRAHAQHKLLGWLDDVKSLAAGQ
jgi:hypothetical protein